MHQNQGFGYAACLLRSKAASQPLDRLCVNEVDKTSVKSQNGRNHVEECQDVM